MFTIGEFSRFAQVTSELLRHYDLIGLFKPDYINPRNGYRYYRARQLPELNRILSLKDLGLSLEQIQQMIADDVTLDEIRGMLKHQRMMTQEVIRQEYMRLQNIEARLRYIDTHNLTPQYPVTMKSRNTTAWASIHKQRYPKLSNGEFFSTMYEAFAPVMRSPQTVCVCAMHDMRLNSDDLSMGVTLPSNARHQREIVANVPLVVGELEAYDTVASVTYNGSIQAYYRAYNALALWIEEHNHSIVGAAYEWIYDIEITESGVDRSTIEIQIPLMS